MEHKCGSGYYCINLLKRSRLAHRMAFYYMTGRLPEKVDHIDGNRLNNEWKNLREATHAENMWNTGMITTNASGVKGVHWHKKLKRWVAEIRTNGKKHYVGSFVDLEAAKTAIEERRKELHSEFFKPDGQIQQPLPAAPEQQNAPRNTRENIPGGWIKCSERMPEEGVEVLVTKKFCGMKTGFYREGVSGNWRVYGATWIPDYWMPLPAAPEQEV